MSKDNIEHPCNDCIHYDLCNSTFSHIPNNQRKKCIHFKDKSTVTLPCKIGDTVFVISKCENVKMDFDNDYFYGTGAVECPFEDSCDFEDCNDNNIKIFKTFVNDFVINKENQIEVYFKNLFIPYKLSDFGKVVFFTYKEAKKKLKEGDY